MRQDVQKILISSCLLGEVVRYDGKSKVLNSPLLQQWMSEERLVALCPEVMGGLTVPRAAAERVGEWVKTAAGDDVSAAFDRGAEAALALCQQHKIGIAVLKEGSPSCGSSTVYDGTFTGQKMTGQGVTTARLREHGVAVFSEWELDAVKRVLEKMEGL